MNKIDILTILNDILTTNEQKLFDDEYLLEKVLKLKKCQSCHKFKIRSYHKPKLHTLHHLPRDNIIKQIIH
jgi:hypothetical protein